MRHHSPLTSHHICPTSRGGSNARENIVRLTERTHVAYHMVFQNLPPAEAIKELVRLNATALTGEFREDIGEILNYPDHEYYYRTGIVKNEKKFYLR